MAAIINHENIQNNINQDASDKVDTTGITFGKAKKVGSTTEYEVSFDDENSKKTTGGSKKMSLQERFAAMRRRKLAQQQHTHYVAKKGTRSLERKKQLRNKFIQQVKKYIGIPYARKYHEVGTPEYESPIFLDCCALIRRAVNDLAQDFGFLLGRWNQNYQFSTLAADTVNFEDMKPGDLIFYEATYYDTSKQKKQPLNMVHIEMFYPGETGQGTIGSRWQKGKVQEFDSYKFTSKNYHSIKYYFCSIDRWLNGECKPTHDIWPQTDMSNMATNKYSMFNVDNYINDEAADCDDDIVNETDSTSNEKKQVRKRFYVGEGNGWKMIRDALNARGDWIQIPFDQGFTQNYQLRWVERRSEINFAMMKTNNQACNHISNNDIITTKKGLLEVVNRLKMEEEKASEYFSEDDDDTDNNVDNNMKKEDDEKNFDTSFFPSSFDFNIASDRLRFMKNALVGSKSPWIVKPIAMNRGRGIKIYTESKICKELMGTQSAGDISSYNGEIDKWAGSNKMNGFICQKYIENPLLINNKKFDIRAYCLISECTEEKFVAFYGPGYLRVALEEFQNGSWDNQYIHLNNIAVQKNHKDYKEKREQSIWNFEQLNNYINNVVDDSNNNIYPKDWVNTTFIAEMKRIMSIVMHGSYKSFEKKNGTFDLLGFDFMVDDYLNVKLIEVNTNPALHKNDGKWLNELFPKLISDTLDIVLTTNGMNSEEDQCTIDNMAMGRNKLFEKIFEKCL
jgi:hypothetical protein